MQFRPADGAVINATGGVLRRKAVGTADTLSALQPRSFLRAAGLILADALAAATAAYLALAFRFDDPLPLTHLVSWAPLVLMTVLIRPTLNRVTGIYRHSLRHVSIPELLQLAWVTILVSVVMFALHVLLAAALPGALAGFPRSFWILEGALSLVLFGTLRILPRIALEMTPPAYSGDGRERAILYGAGDAGALMARGAARLRSTTVRPVAFLDDDPRKWGTIHAGLKVEGDLTALAATARSTGASVVLVTMPTASGEAIRRVADAALAAGLRVRTVPSLDEMVDGSFSPDAIRPLQMEDLLRRAPVEPSVLAELGEDLGREVVLVTGAAGSIGSELARQLAALAPASLVLIDRAEGPLYELQRDLDARPRSTTSGTVQYRICDLTNAHATRRLIETVRPTVVFHAAAYKHVPMMEENPSYAVEVNVGGTLTLLEACEEAGVERLVLVSTDKAVDPSSVMGATKRMAELLVREFSARLGRPWVSVRFGNVLGSSGSVIPIFERQLERGEPLTVTHEDMTRFFMTIPEAVHLILQAATLARAGDLFVLDMGEPVKILDLATEFLRLRGRDPLRTPIRITGLRPGEKMHEKLFFPDEKVVATRHQKVHRVVSRVQEPAARVAAARRLVSLAHNADDRSLRKALIGAVASDTPDSSLPLARPRLTGALRGAGCRRRRDPLRVPGAGYSMGGVRELPTEVFGA